MKATQVTVGMRVAVNSVADGWVYVVDSVEGFLASLSYVSGAKRLSAGQMDVSCLRKPTKQQLENAAKHAAAATQTAEDEVE